MIDNLAPAEWTALRLSLIVAFYNVVLSLPLAVAVAWLLARGRFWGRGLVDALVHIPLVLPPVLVGYVLLILFGVRGPIGSLLNETLGVRLVFTKIGRAHV